MLIWMTFWAVYLLAQISQSSCRDVNLGILLPITGAFRVGKIILPIIDQAINETRKRGLLSGYNITYAVRNSGCRNEIAPGVTAELYSSQARPNAFIGPGCSVSCLSAGLLATYWNIPMISYSCSSSDLENRRSYATFARTQAFSRTYSKSTPYILLELMRSYKWKRAAIVTSYSGGAQDIWEPIASSLRKTFLNSSIIVPYYKVLGDASRKEQVRMMADAKQQARIMFVIGNKKHTSELMVIAESLGMLNGSYAFITLDFYVSKDIEEHMHAYEGMITLTVNKSSAEQVEDMANWLKEKDPENANETSVSSAAKTAPFLHDAILLYAYALNKTLSTGGSIENGKAISQQMIQYSPVFKGMTGPVVIDNKGNRVPVFAFENIQNYTNAKFVQLSTYWANGTLRSHVNNVTIWPGGGTTRPDDDPTCVFTSCPDDGRKHGELIIPISCALGVMTLLSILTGIYFFRKRRYEHNLLSLSWLINYDDISPVNVDTRFASKVIKECYDNHSRWSRLTDHFTTPSSTRDVGRYKGEFVAIKKLRKDSLTLTRDMLVDMKKVRDIMHTNLVPYVGVCVTAPNISIISQYCHRGSLQEILANDDFKLDWFFRASFANDIAVGMHVLHSSHIHIHGDLRSCKCLIDNRWVCKVADYGLGLLKANQKPDQDAGEHALYSKLFWRAPELLEMSKTNRGPSQAGDVYSFGIILSELLTREEPYSTSDFAPKEVVERVRCHLDPPFRPQTPPEIMNKSIALLMEKCWDDNPHARPTFSDIKANLRALSKGKSSIVDNMLRLMENYTEQLETLVDERTRQLAEEKAKTDELLYKMLPKSIAEALKRGEPVMAESFSSVTIFFSDIVGFTSLAANSTPLQVVDLLNDLYTSFDNVIDAHDVYKIETIGDAYMVVSGLPVRNGRRHAGEIATMALNLLSCTLNFRIRHFPSKQLQLRIGMHSGSCVAGVVGLKMPRYCLFGDTVNYASRMESSGLALRIHVSPECKSILDELGGYHLQERGPVELKGKGKITTYFLNGKDDFTKQLPDATGIGPYTVLSEDGDLEED